MRCVNAVCRAVCNVKLGRGRRTKCHVWDSEGIASVLNGTLYVILFNAMTSIKVFEVY